MTRTTQRQTPREIDRLLNSASKDDRNGSPLSLPPSRIANSAEDEVVTMPHGVRKTQPTGVIAIGGSAIRAVSEAKRLTLEQGTHHFACYRAIDTDANAQNGSTFTAEEFLDLQTTRIKNVLQNQEMHRPLVVRFDIDDQESASTFHDLVGRRMDHGGQVRPYACLALMTEFSKVKSSVMQMLRELTASMARLKQQLQSNYEADIHDRIRIYVVFSLAGGTGSGIGPTLLSWLKHWTKNKVDIVAVCIAPSAFELEFQGRHEQLTRTKASGFAAMMELEAIQDGFSERCNIPLNADEQNPLFLPRGLTQQTFVVGRRTANGADLESVAAVRDQISNYLAALIGTELNDVIGMEDRNDESLDGQSTDPQTGNPRNVSTLGAMGLTIDINRQLLNLVQSALLEFIREEALGQAPAKPEVELMVERWISNPTSDPSHSLDTERVIRRVHKAVAPPIANRTRSLFKGFKRKRPVHLPDRKYASRMRDLLDAVNREMLPACDDTLGLCYESLRAELLPALKLQLSNLTREHGSLTAGEFARLVQSALESQGQALIESAKNDQNKVNKSIAGLESVSVDWSKRRLRVWKAKQQQIRLASELTNTVNLAALSRTKQSIGELMVQLASCAGKVSKQSGVNFDAAKMRIERCLKLKSDSRSGQRLTTDNLAEIDVSTPWTDQKLLLRFRPQWGEIGPADSSRADWLLRVCSDSAAFDQLESQFVEVFTKQLETVTVVDLIADQLRNPQESKATLAKLHQAVLGTQPCWEAESGQINVKFSDSIYIGVPEATNRANRDLVIDAMKALESDVNADGQYEAEPKPVTSGDRHKIYVIRRTSGASWHFLQEVRDCGVAYREWNQNGGHSVHTFGKAAVQQMPSLLPQPKPKPIEITLALGLAYGFIAQRGPRFYENLAIAKDGSYRCSLATHWPSINPYDSFGDGPSSLSILIAKGRIVYGAGHEVERVNNVGDSLRSVASHLTRNHQLCKTIDDAFVEMRTLTEVDALVLELDRYVSKLMSNARGYEREPLGFQKILDCIKWVKEDLQKQIVPV